MKKWAILFSLVFLLCGVNQASAQDPTRIPDDQVNAIARDLYCPVCENIPLDVCPTKACAQWRELIREKLALGWSQKEIEVFFAQQYGEKVLSVPRPAGFNWAIYFLPPVFVVFGIILIVRVIRKSRKETRLESGQTPAESPVTADLLKKIEDDLKDME